MLIVGVSAFLVGAVIYDLVSHRLPNFYLLSGLLFALVSQFFSFGWGGVSNAGIGLLLGFSLLIPLYALGGMAAGDVKLMAVVGVFLGSNGVLWGGVFSLIFGGLFGFLYLVYKGQFGRLLGRYWAMASLRSYIPAEDTDAARHRFPYAISIASGTFLSLYWTPI